MKEKKKEGFPSNYSEAFKRIVITEYESGLSSKATLKRKYGIAGNSCIPRWLKKYGKLEHPNYSSKGRPMKDKDKQYVKEFEAQLRVNEKVFEKKLKLKDAELKAEGIKMGRDKLFDYLRSEQLLVPNRKKYHITTTSKHWMRKYPNSIKGIEINRPEQVWVADITYLQVNKKHYYLHLVTDAYSKRIVGFELADNMQAETTLTKAI